MKTNYLTRANAFRAHQITFLVSGGVLLLKSGPNHLPRAMTSGKFIIGKILRSICTSSIYCEAHYNYFITI